MKTLLHTKSIYMGCFFPRRNRNEAEAAGPPLAAGSSSAGELCFALLSLWGIFPGFPFLLFDSLIPRKVTYTSGISHPPVCDLGFLGALISLTGPHKFWLYWHSVRIKAHTHIPGLSHNRPANTALVWSWIYPEAAGIAHFHGSWVWAPHMPTLAKASFFRHVVLLHYSHMCLHLLTLSPSKNPSPWTASPLLPLPKTTCSPSSCSCTQAVTHCHIPNRSPLPLHPISASCFSSSGITHFSLCKQLFLWWGAGAERCRLNTFSPPMDPNWQFHLLLLPSVTNQVPAAQALLMHQQLFSSSSSPGEAVCPNLQSLCT